MPDRSTLDIANQAQREAANPAGSRLAAANAGSGKTRVLVSRVSRILLKGCLLYTSPSPRDATLSRMPSSA